jgi:hypothetical protein
LCLIALPTRHCPVYLPARIAVYGNPFGAYSVYLVAGAV